MNNKSLKQEHEIAVCKRFLLLYVSHSKKNTFFVREGDPAKKEPDCLCSDNTAIELVGVYDNKYQAQKIWNAARKKRLTIKPQYQLTTLQNLESEIAKKLKKLNEGNYKGFLGDILLVCNLHSPLLQDCEVEKFVSEYIPFRKDNFFNNYFHEVWVIWNSDVDGSSKIARLE